MVLAALWWAFLIAAPHQAKCTNLDESGGREPVRFERAFPAMGVEFRVIAFARSDQQFEDALAQLKKRVLELEKILSDYDNQSEVSALCRMAPHRKPVSISADLWNVCRASEFFYHRTGGTYDPTIGPVTKIWRMARKRNRLPDSADLEKAMRSVGWTKVALSSRQPLIQLTEPEMQLDFGGIGKGYAADQAIEVLAQHGIHQALVDAGGDIRVADPPPGMSGWKIAVEGWALNSSSTPEAAGDRNGSRKLVIRNAAVATSGSTRQRLVKNGQSHSHLIDPRTGSAITRTGNVTVIADSATTADAMATALSVLGPDVGIELLKEFSTAVAAFVEPPHESKPSRCRFSPGFEKFLTAPAENSIADPAAGFSN